MTNKEKIKIIIKDDFDKKKNHDNIIKLIEKNKKERNHFKYAVIPVCLFLFITIWFVQINDKDTYNDDYDNFNKNPEFDSLIIENDIQINYLRKYNDGGSKYNVINNVNIPYCKILTELSIPEDFDNKDYHRAIGIDVKVNNYESWYLNTTNNRRIIIAYSNENIPLRNKNINIKNPKTSSIKGLDVQIYKYNNIFISKFYYGGYNFSIECRDISIDEFISLIESIVK